MMHLCPFSNIFFSLNRFTVFGGLDVLAWSPETGFQRWIFTNNFCLLGSDQIIDLLHSSTACFINMGWLVSESGCWHFSRNVLHRGNVLIINQQHPQFTFSLFTSAWSHSYGLLFTCVQGFAEGEICFTDLHLAVSAGMDRNFFRRNGEICSGFPCHDSNSCQRRQPEGKTQLMDSDTWSPKYSTTKSQMPTGVTIA